MKAPLLDTLVVQGTAFPVPERERLELRGLLPKKCLSMQAQVCIVYAQCSGDCRVFLLGRVQPPVSHMQ